MYNMNVALGGRIAFSFIKWVAACAMCLFAWQANDVWPPSARMPAPWISLWHFLSWSWKWRGCHPQDPGVEFCRERFLTVGALELSWAIYCWRKTPATSLNGCVVCLMTERNCLILLLAILEFASHVFFFHFSITFQKHEKNTGQSLVLGNWKTGTLNIRVIFILTFVFGMWSRIISCVFVDGA